MKNDPQPIRPDIDKQESDPERSICHRLGKQPSTIRSSAESGYRYD
ncbi:MAG: hypothetical protein ACI87E_005172 [Mariniblastus sp.]